MSFLRKIFLLSFARKTNSSVKLSVEDAKGGHIIHKIQILLTYFHWGKVDKGNDVFR
jgi:hypothetical protein